MRNIFCSKFVPLFSVLGMLFNVGVGRERERERETEKKRVAKYRM